MSAAKIKPNPLKVELRKDVEARLHAMSGDDRDRQSKIILEKIFAHPKYQSAKRIALYMSLPNEVPTESLLKDILARGDTPFVPQYAGGRMRMLRVLPVDLNLMVETSWKIKQHAKDAVREDALDNGGVELVVAPGAAFTRAGARCGHGGGYYDRYLAGLRARRRADPRAFREPYVLAVGFTQQIYPQIPVDKQDEPVDEVVTAD